MLDEQLKKKIEQMTQWYNFFFKDGIQVTLFWKQKFLLLDFYWRLLVASH